MKYSNKVVLCGNVIEVYKYIGDVSYGYKTNGKGRAVIADEDNKELNREKVCKRARIDLMRIINTNYKKGSSRFITLTFKENITDLQLANYEFKKFVQRWQYKLGYKLQYSVVVEFQKRGAVHYHSIFYNIPHKVNLNDLRAVWGLGSVNVKRINHVDNVGAYMVKYMSKNSDDERLKGQKMYFNSRGLKKPEIIMDCDLVNSVLMSLQDQSPKYSTSYDIFYNDAVQNSVIYKQYIID